MQKLECANWIHTVECSSLVLGYQSLACSIHPTGCKKAMHEKYSFSDMIFVNYSTSQTWSFLENEQFCIKWSISVNGGVLTSSHRAQCWPEKPSQVELLELGWGSRLCLTTPGDCPTLGCKGQRITFPFVKNGLDKAAQILLLTATHSTRLSQIIKESI